MASFNDPKVTNSILSDVNALRALIRSLATMNPASGNTDMPEGSIQFISTSGGMQFRQYNGSAWSAITSKLMHDVDKVDGYDASKTSTAENIIPVYKIGGLIAGGCEGNAGTASKLKTPVTIDLGGYISGTAVQFDGSKDVTLNVNRIDVNNDSDNVLNGIISKAHGGTGRNDGAASDIVLADGGLASEYGQIGQAVNITGKDLNSLVKSGNYFSITGTVAQNYPTNFGENIYVIVSEYGVYRKQLLYSENEVWVRDSKDSGASWNGWIMLSASRESAFIIYISKSGSDYNTGLTSDSPVLSITRALSIAYKMIPHGINKYVVFCVGEGDWGTVSLNSLPFLLRFSDYTNSSNIDSYTESLPKFDSITANNSYISIKNSVVDHIATDRCGVIFTDGYLRFSRITSQNFSEVYIASKSNEIKSMSSQTSVLYVNQRGQIILGGTSFKIVENLNLSIAFAVMYATSYIYFNNASFSLNSGVSVTGKKYTIGAGGHALAAKSYLDSLPGTIAGTIETGAIINGIPYGGGSSDSALMADLSWKQVLLKTGGTLTGFVYYKFDSLDDSTVPSSTIYTHPIVVRDKNNVDVGHLSLNQNTSGYNFMRLAAKKGSSTEAYFDLYTDGTTRYITTNASYLNLDTNPASNDDSTRAATTAWVRDRLASYLPLAGGAISGNLQFNRKGARNFMIEQNDQGFVIGTRPSGGWKSAIVFRNDSYSANPAGLELFTGTNFGGPALLLKKNGQAAWNGKHIVRSVNGTNADTNGNVNISSIGAASTADTLSGCIGGYGGPVTLPNYGTWAYVASTNYRSWGAGSSDGSSYGGVAAGGTTLNFDSRGTGYLIVRIS